MQKNYIQIYKYVIATNRSEPSEFKLGKFYCDNRNLKHKNIVNIQMFAFTSCRPKFIDSLFKTVKAFLVNYNSCSFRYKNPGYALSLPDVTLSAGIKL